MVSVRAWGGFTGGGVDRLAVDQPVQQVQDMGLGRHAGLQRQFDGGEHGLLVVLQDQGQDLDHLAVAARRLEQMLLQRPEGVAAVRRRVRRCAGRRACAG